MNKKFHRALSSVLAFVMLLSCMTIMNVSSAFAAAYSYEYIPNDPVVNTDNYFIAPTDSSAYQASSSALKDVSVTSIDDAQVAITRGLKMNSGGSVTFTVAGEANVTIVWAARTDKTDSGNFTLKVDDTVLTDTAEPTGDYITSQVTLGAGTHTITRGGSVEGVLYYVRVDDTVSDNAHIYSITGTCNLNSGDTFALGSYTATVGANGGFSVRRVAETAPFAVGSEFAVSKDQYDADPASVILTAGSDDYNFSAGNITFTKMELGALAQGTYNASTIMEGLPGFEITGNVADAKVSNGGMIGFKLDRPAVVTVKAKIGTTSADRSAALLWADNNAGTDAQTLCALTSDNTEFVEYTIPVDLKAGTYYLIGQSPAVGEAFEGTSSTSVQIDSIKIDYDAAAVIDVTPSYTINGTPVGSGVVTIEGKEYTIGETISAFIEGEYTVVYIDGDNTPYRGTLIVSEENLTPEVELEEVTSLTVTGEVTVQGSDTVPDGVSITYSDINGEYPVTMSGDRKSYTVDLAPGTYSVKATTLSGYTLSSLSVDDFTVSATDYDENFNNILYKKNAVPATAKDVYVSADASGDNHYPTINEAIAGIKASSLSSNENDKWIVHIAPGTYREQVIVDVNNVTFICDSDGDLSDNETGATVTWYYGVGYKYYSIKPNDKDSVDYDRGYYDIEYAYDKHSKATADRWACTVRVTGSNFYAENIDFEASFNRAYLAEIEEADGVEPAAEWEYGGTGTEVELPVRTAENFADDDATERAAAIVLDNSRAEFYNCSMKSSQDTLYMGASCTAYFNNCTIQGQTDYIFGDVSTALFDDCTLVWAGYTKSAKPGYITAARGNMLFRNCTISNQTDVAGATVVPGYLGRHWGNTPLVIFADTKGIDTTNLVSSTAAGQVAYFQNPSSLTKTEVDSNEDGINVREYYVTTDAVYSGSKYTEPMNVLTSTGTRSDFTVTAEDVQGPTYLGAWTPVNYPYDEIAGAPKYYGFDFAAAGTDVSGVANYNSSDEDASITLDATGGRIVYNSPQHGYNFKPGSAIKFTVGSDSTDNLNVTLTFNVTANGTAVAVYKADDLNTPVSEVVALSNINNTVSFTAVSGETYAFVVGGTGDFYSPTLTITTSGTITALEQPTIINWDFSELPAVEYNGSTGYVESDVAGVRMYVDATAGKFNIGNNPTYAQFNTGTILQIPVYAVGDVLTVVGYDTQYSVGEEPAVDKTTLHTVTAEDVVVGYVEIVSTGGSYIEAIMLSTTADIPTTENVFVFDSAVKSADGTTLYVIGKVAEDALNKADEIGFTGGLSMETSKATELLRTAAVATVVSDGGTEIRAAEEGYYFAAFAMTGVTDDFVVVPYTTTGGVTVYGDATTVEYNAENTTLDA